MYPWNNMFASDIEATGLLEDMKRQENPHLHNIGYIDVKTGEEVCIEWTDRARIQAFLDTGPTLIDRKSVV